MLATSVVPLIDRGQRRVTRNIVERITPAKRSKLFSLGFGTARCR